METWRFLYTHLSNYKKAVHKNGSPKRGATKYIIEYGNSYAQALKQAKSNGVFNDSQLLGAAQVTQA